MSTPKAALRKLDQRDGHECAWHGVNCGTDTLVPQHRQGGMGGSPLKHRLSNIVWLCSRMNGDIESDADLAQEARERGIKVGFWADTETIPVVYADGSPWWLSDDGTKRGQPF